MTYEVNTRSGVKVLATGEDINYLGNVTNVEEVRTGMGVSSTNG